MNPLRMPVAVGAAGGSVLVDRLLWKTPRATTRRPAALTFVTCFLRTGPQLFLRLPPRRVGMAAGESMDFMAALAALRGRGRAGAVGGR